jgi:hypothetical protein
MGSLRPLARERNFSSALVPGRPIRFAALKASVCDVTSDFFVNRNFVVDEPFSRGILCGKGVVNDFLSAFEYAGSSMFTASCLVDPRKPRSVLAR